MAYRFQVNHQTCINCGICMDLCPVRCLDMTRPSGEGERAQAEELLTPIPGDTAAHSWMMLSPVQVAQCIGCQVCAQECPTNAITIASSEKELTYARRGPVAYLPPEHGWQPLDAYTRAFPEEPGETPWGDGHAWHVAERQATWQSWRTWLGERKEDLRAPCQAACPVGTNAGLYVSLIAEGRYDEALQVASEPNPFPCICGRVCTAPCEDVCRRGEFDLPIAIRDLKRFAMDHGAPRTRKVIPPRQWYEERVAIVGAGPTGLSAAYYLARRGYRVTVYDAMPVAGGMMSIGIPDYRLPRAELHRDIDAMRELGVEIILDTAVGRDITLYELQEQFDAVLLAVGAQRSQRLGIPGETELHGVIPATTFLKDFNLDPETKLREMWQSSAVAARQWMQHARLYVLALAPCTSSIAVRAPKCPPRPTRYAPRSRRVSNYTNLLFPCRSFHRRAMYEASAASAWRSASLTRRDGASLCRFLARSSICRLISCSLRSVRLLIHPSCRRGRALALPPGAAC